MDRKATGIVRKIDELGRITLPIELRKSMNIGEKAPIEMFTEGDAIILKKYKSKIVCCNCGEEHPNMIRAEHGDICPDCLDIFNAWK